MPAYVDDSTLELTGDATSVFLPDRRVQLDCGSDGIRISEVESASYDEGEDVTSVALQTANLTENLQNVSVGSVGSGEEGALPLHDHSSRHQGGEIPPTKYVHEQGTPSETWDIQHNLGYRPHVLVINSAGERVYGWEEHVSSDRVLLKWKSAFSGTAYLS